MKALSLYCIKKSLIRITRNIFLHDEFEISTVLVFQSLLIKCFHKIFIHARWITIHQKDVEVGKIKREFRVRKVWKVQKRFSLSEILYIRQSYPQNVDVSESRNLFQWVLFLKWSLKAKKNIFEGDRSYMLMTRQL